MFEHLLRLWMGIWLCTHTITTTDASLDLGKLAEILPDASVQTMPLRFDWVCRNFQTTSHVHGVPYMQCLITFSSCGWANGFTFTSLPPQTLPQICESCLKSYLLQVCKPCHNDLFEAVEPFKLHSITIAYLYEVFKHLCILLLTRNEDSILVKPV